jgi:DNA-directed RNA polymerase specialized sigma24 family protein
MTDQPQAVHSKQPQPQPQHPKPKQPQSLDFAAAWPPAAASVVRSLVWHGFDRAVAEDATQEAGARFLEGRAARSNTATPGEFQRWLYVVARNVAVDHHRKAAAASANLPWAIPAPAADHVVEHRLKWEVVVGRLAQMDAPYRHLAGELLGRPREGARLNVERKRLERLRKRLSEAIVTAVGA